jgi:cytochrome bd ubiquinol oxidase subunit II
MTAAALPLWLAVGGIVLRGAGFAFRKEVSGLGLQRAFGAVFALSSLLTPFFMGTVIGAVAAGKVPADAGHASMAAWTNPTSLLIGLLFVGACGYLAAVYLVGEAKRRGDRRMQDYFSRRALAAGAATGALSLATLLELHGPAPALQHNLVGRALPLVILAGVTGLAVLVLLAAGRPRGIRVLAAIGVAAVVWGWGVAQYPALLPGTPVTLSNAGAPHSTLVALVVLFVVVVVLIGPSFGLLFALHGRQLLQGGDGFTASAGNAGSPARRPRSWVPPGRMSRAVAIGLIAAGAVVRARGRNR